LRGLFAHLTVAMLAAHTVLGCCWHHAHECGQSHDSLSLLGWQHHEESPHQDVGGCSRCSDHSPAPDGCRAVRCDFVARKAPPGPFSGAFAPPAVLTLPEAGPASLRMCAAQQVGANGADLSPIRLHLLLQVLLI
jgi:hypothetical protein